jgi:hypothetical protein
MWFADLLRSKIPCFAPTSKTSADAKFEDPVSFHEFLARTQCPAFVPANVVQPPNELYDTFWDSCCASRVNPKYIGRTRRYIRRALKDLFASADPFGKLSIETSALHSNSSCASTPRECGSTRETFVSSPSPRSEYGSFATINAMGRSFGSLGSIHELKCGGGCDRESPAKNASTQMVRYGFERGESIGDASDMTTASARTTPQRVDSPFFAHSDDALKL